MTAHQAVKELKHKLTNPIHCKNALLLANLLLQYLIARTKLRENTNGNLADVRLYSHIFVHTYVHNWSLKPFSQYYGLASHTTHVLCVNFICEWWDIQFNGYSERQIFLRNFFMAGLFTFRRNISYFVLMPDLGYEPSIYGDFGYIRW